MRLKVLYNLPVFFILIIMLSYFSIYHFYKEIINEDLEFKLIDTANDLQIAINNNANIMRDLSKEALLAKSNEFGAGSIFIQFSDLSGKPLARSASLHNNYLPFASKANELIRDLTLENNETLKVYQKTILLNNKPAGYLMVGLSADHLIPALANLRFAMYVFFVISILILGLGINIIYAQKVLQQQRNILSFASHELRIPLSVINGHTEVTLRGEKDLEEYKKTLELISNETKVMTRNIDNFLSFMRTESGILKIKKENINLGIILTEETSALKKRFPSKKIIINLLPEAEIIADPDLIRIMLSNLLDNAAKNTPDTGEIAVNLKAQARYLMISIKDNGPGIEKENIKKILKPFYQTKSARSGYGLGLAIVDWIVKVHRGRIKINLQNKSGTEILIYLPKKLRFNITHYHNAEQTIV